VLTAGVRHVAACRTRPQEGGDLDMMFLYRRSIPDCWCETGDDLARIVGHVLIHEVGYRFGLGNEDMHRIENS
jgi:predicted Zn-dependent protease with MMP-like domain